MDEKLKEQLLPALIVFCWTVLGWVLYRYFTSELAWTMGGFVVQVLIGAGIGLLTGGITLGVMMMRK